MMLAPVCSIEKPFISLSLTYERSEGKMNERLWNATSYAVLLNFDRDCVGRLNGHWPNSLCDSAFTYSFRMRANVQRTALQFCDFFFFLFSYSLRE